MAWSTDMVLEVRTDGSDTNGGGYSSGGTDYSQQAAAQLSVADAVCAGNTTVTSATGGFTSAMIGNLMYLSSGPGWYEITAYTDTNTVTIDQNGPNASGMTANVGGALLTIGQVASLASANFSFDTWVRGGTYQLSSGITFANSANVYGTFLKGYSTSRGDGGKPLIQHNGVAGAFDLLVSSATYFNVINFEFDGQDIATIGLHMAATRSNCHNIKASRCATYGVQTNTGGGSRIEVTDMKAGATSGVESVGPIAYSIAHSNPCRGFSTVSNGSFQWCTAAHNTGKGFDGGIYFDHAVAHSNSSDGIYLADSSDVAVVVNSILTSNGGYGINGGNKVVAAWMDYNAYYNNTSGARNGVPAGSNDVTLTGDPFVNSAAGVLNFALDSTAGEGADCRNVAFQTDPTGATVGYADIGVARHQDPSGGGLVGMAMLGGRQK
jgi:hypothetical protein